jgi:hypothetical protein
MGLWKWIPKIFGHKEESIGCKRIIWKAAGICRLPLNEARSTNNR